MLIFTSVYKELDTLMQLSSQTFLSEPKIIAS